MELCWLVHISIWILLLCAWVCYQIDFDMVCHFQNAAGQCMHDRLKLFHSLLSPPAHAVWKRNGKVATTMTSTLSLTSLIAMVCSLNIHWSIHIALCEWCDLRSVFRVMWIIHTCIYIMLENLRKGCNFFHKRKDCMGPNSMQSYYPNCSLVRYLLEDCLYKITAK